MISLTSIWKSDIVNLRVLLLHYFSPEVKYGSLHLDTYYRRNYVQKHTDYFIMVHIISQLWIIDKCYQAKYNAMKSQTLSHYVFKNWSNYLYFLIYRRVGLIQISENRYILKRVSIMKIFAEQTERLIHYSVVN